MKKKIFGAAALLIAASIVSISAAAASAAGAWPDRPITFVAPFSPGGANDLIARIFAKRLSMELKQDIIVENRPGAGGIVGTTHVAHLKPDGYTYLIAGNGMVTNSLLRSDLPYKDSELTPVAMLCVAPSVIVVNPSNPANNLKELIANAKSSGSAHLPFATAGVGTTPDFVGAMMKQETGLPIEIIPYKSGSEGVTAVVGNQVIATSEASIVVLPLIQAGKLKALATTWVNKLPTAPDIKTTAEEGFPNIRIGHWEALFAPSGVPVAILDKMNAAVREAARSKEVVEALNRTSVEPGHETRSELIKFTENERVRLGKIVAQGHMRPD